MNRENVDNSGRLEVIRPQRRDFQMFTESATSEHYIKNGFEYYTADLITKYLPDGGLFIDIGAHQGFYSLLAGTKNKNSRIMAFEPVPESCEILKKSLELNHLANVELYNLAVSDTDETRIYNVGQRSSRSGFYKHPMTETIRTIEVKTITLDHLIQTIPDVPVVVKIDTEGHEWHVLEGMKNLLAKTRDIKLFLEFNPDCLKSAGHQPGELLNKINGLGLEIYFIDDERREIFKLAEDNLANWADYFGLGNFQKNYFNLLCIKKEMSLSVCFFSHSAGLGGAERSLLELVSELIHDHGVVCSVVFPWDGPLREMIEATGASTQVINYAWWSELEQTSEADRNTRLTNSYKNIFTNIQQKLGKQNFDIIFTQTMVIPWGALTACSLGKPHVWNIREFGILDHGLKFFQPFDYVLDFIWHSSNMILVTSEAVKNALFSPDQKKEVQTLYSFVSIPSAALTLDKESYFTRREATKLVVSGAIHEGKGQEDAVLAVKELIRRGQDVELVIMGQGANEYARQLETTVKNDSLEAYIKFREFRENPYPVVNQADIVLMCSRREAFGRVTVEAMLLKKPVIATKTGGSPELIADEYNGLLYSPGDYLQLADKIFYFIEHRDKIKELGENGYQFAKKKFTREAYGGKVYKLLTNVKNEANPLTSEYSRFMMKMVSGISSELQEKNTLIGNLEASLQQKTMQINDLEVSLQQKTTQTNNLEASLQQKATQINVLEAGVQQKTSQVNGLETRLEQKSSQINSIEAALQQRAVQINNLENNLQQKASQINILENNLRQVQNRIVIQFGNRYQRIVEKLLKPGSIRRKYYETMLSGFRVILNEGWRSLWRKARGHWRSGHK
jgi:FkbM family methyltransferase